jgi:hypothetical protein
MIELPSLRSSRPESFAIAGSRYWAGWCEMCGTRIRIHKSRIEKPNYCSHCQQMFRPVARFYCLTWRQRMKLDILDDE